MSTMEGRLADLAEQLEKMAADKFAKGHGETENELRGFLDGKSQAYELCALWIRRDVLRERALESCRRQEVNGVDPMSGKE